MVIRKRRFFRNISMSLLVFLLLICVTSSIAFGRQCKVLPNKVDLATEAFFDGDLQEPVRLNDLLQQGSTSLVFSFEEPTQLETVKLYLLEGSDLGLSLAYLDPSGNWKSWPGLGTIDLDLYTAGWIRMALDQNICAEAIQITLVGTSQYTNTRISEIEFWGENSEGLVETFLATDATVEFGKNMGAVESYTYTIPVTRNLATLEQSALTFSAKDLEAQEGNYSINENNFYWLTGEEPKDKHEWKEIRRLIHPDQILTGDNELTIHLGDRKKNGFYLGNVGLELKFDRGQVSVQQMKLYQDGQLISDSSLETGLDIMTQEILDGEPTTFWESKADYPGEVVFHLYFDQKIWLEVIDLNYTFLFAGKISVEYLQNDQWLAIPDWYERDVQELLVGLNHVFVGEQKIITDQLRVRVTNGGYYPILGRLCDLQVWGSRTESKNKEPEVVISYPEAESYVGNHTVLQGYVRHDFENIMFNNADLATDGGSFEVEVNMSKYRSPNEKKPGSNTQHQGNGSGLLQVTATNSQGVESQDQVVVYMDTPPVVEIIEPADQIYTQMSEVLIRGTVDKSSYDLKVNEIPLTYYDNQFSILYDLMPGKNVLTVSAIANKGMEAQDQIQVFYDQQTPILLFDEFYDQLLLGKDTIELKGQIYDYSSYSFKINNQLIPVDRGRFSHLFELAEGSNLFECRVLDQVGNETIQSIEIVRDMTPPTPFEPVVEPSGWSQNNQPMIHFGTTDDIAGVSYYKLRIDGGEYSQVISPYLLPSLSDGTHLIEVKAVDMLGWSRTESVQVYVDTTVPEIETFWATTDDWSQISTPTARFEGSDEHSGVAYYELKIDDGEYQVVESPYTLPKLSDGIHKIWVKVVDGVGLSREDSISVYIDTTPPNPFEVIAEPANWSQEQRPIIHFATQDEHSGISHYELQIDEGAPQVVESPYQLPELADGVHDLSIKAVDQVGLFTIAKTQVFVDTTVPKLVSLEASSPNWSQDTRPSIIFSGYDRDSGISHYEMQIDDGLYQVVESPVVLPYLTDGIHNIGVRIIDQVGLSSEGRISVYVDTTLPEDYTPSVEPSGWSQEKSPVVRFATQDLHSGISHYELRIDGGEFRVVESPYSIPELDDGIHLVELKAIDQVGLSRTKELHVYVDTSAPENFQPIAEPGTWSQNQQPVVAFGTEDIYSGISHYELKIDTGDYRQVESPYSLPSLEDGIHEIAVKAVDQVGLITVETMNVFVDTTPPVIQNLVADPGDWSQEAQPVISFFGHDTDSGIGHYTVTIDDGVETVIESPYKLPPLSDGIHTVRVKVTDNVELSTTRDINVYVDTTPPTIPTTFKAIPGPDKVELSWEQSVEEDVTHYRVYREPEWTDGVAYKSFTNLDEKYVYEDFDVVYGETYYYELVVEDHVGNLSEPFGDESLAGYVEERVEPETGGTIEFTEVTVEVPEDAITETGVIEVKNVSSEAAAPAINRIVGDVVSVNLRDPETGEVQTLPTFAKDLIMTFSYDEDDMEDGLDELLLDIYYFDEEMNLWVKIPAVERDFDKNTITVQVNHLTDFSQQITENYSPTASEYRDMGLSPYQSYFENNNEYVNPASGVLTINTTDLKIPGRGMDLVIGRIYNYVQATTKFTQSYPNEMDGYKTFSPGWSLNIPYISSDSGAIIFHTESGSSIRIKFNHWPSDRHDYYYNHENGFHVISYKVDNGNLFKKEDYGVILPSGIKYIFDPNGYIKSKTDPNGNTITYSIDDNGKINQIVDTIGRIITFTYENDRLKRLSYDGKSYQYHYNGSKDLISYEDPMGRVTGYRYTEKELYIKKRTTKDGIIISDKSRSDNYEARMLSLIKYPTGGISSYNIEILDHDVEFLSYGSKYNVVITKGTKVAVTEHKQYLNDTDFNADQNIIKQKNYEYIFGEDADFIIKSTMTTPQHIQTVMSYNPEGMLLEKKVYDLTRTSQIAIEKMVYEYNDNNELISEKLYRDGAFKNQKTYRYDNWGNKIYERNSANDSVTHYQYLNTDSTKSDWPDYQTPPVGVSTGVKDIFNLLSDTLSTNRNPETGKILLIQKHYRYDLKGNILGEYSYSSYDQAWYQNQYTYDQYGNVKTMIDPEGNMTSMRYDSSLGSAYLTRVSKEVTLPKLSENDPTRTQEIVRYYGYNEDTGDQIWELDPEGFLTTYEYDTLGRLVQIIYPDDDDQKITSYLDYSQYPLVNGRENNPTKVQVYNDSNSEVVVANLSRPIVGSLDSLDLSLSNNSIEENLVFNKTRYCYDALNRLKEIQQYLRDEELLPGQQSPLVTSFEYDLAGNQTIVTDAENNTTEKKYDGLGRIVEIIYPAVETYDGKQPKTVIQYYDGVNKREIIDGRGNKVIEEKDWLGNVTRISQEIEGTKYSASRVYDQRNQVVKEVDPENRVTRYYYDSLGNLRKKELPGDEYIVRMDNTSTGTATNWEVPTILYDYNRTGKLISQMNPAGFAVYGSNAKNYLNQQVPYVTNNYYDELGQLVRTVQGNEREVWHFYDKNSREIKTVSSGGQIVRKEYTARGWVKAEMLVNALDELDYIDKNGNVRLPETWTTSEIYDPATSQITYKEYDLIGNVIAETAPEGMNPGDDSDNDLSLFEKKWDLDDQYTLTYTYDALARKRSQEQTVEGKLYRSLYHYDNVGNVIRTVNPANQVVETYYNDVYWVTEEVQYAGLFDSLPGWSSINPSGVVDEGIALVTKYEYDAVGNKRLATDPSGYSTEYRYDALNRLIEVVDAANNTISYEYDRIGNKTKEIDATRKSTWYIYNTQNQLEQVTEAHGGITNYYYDVTGNLTAKVMDDGHTTTYWYDQFSQMTAEKRAYDNKIYYRYDKSGNLMRNIDRKGQTIEYTYNHMGMPVQTDFIAANGNIEDSNVYDYDKNGNIVNARNGNSMIQTVINPLGQITSEIREIGGSTYQMGYQYNLAGKMTEMVYPSTNQSEITSPGTSINSIGFTNSVNANGQISPQVNYMYDNYNRLIGIPGFADGTPDNPAFTYRANGALKSMRYNNMTNTHLELDELNRVEEIRVVGLSQDDPQATQLLENLFHTSYEFDGANNVKKRTNHLTGYVNDYDYDELHRLTDAKVEGGFIQERRPFPLVAEGDFNTSKSLLEVSDELYQIDLDYNANSIGIAFNVAVPVSKVKLKHYKDGIEALAHRIKKSAISIHTSSDNSIFTEVDPNLWELELDPYGNIVLLFTEDVQTRYLKIHFRYEDRDADYGIVNIAEFGNYLKDLVKVYHRADEGVLSYYYDSVGNRTKKKRTVLGTEDYVYHYDTSNRRLLYITKVDIDGVEENWRGYEYDANGNMVGKSNKFTVNADGGVTLITEGANVEYWEYSYNVQNRLVAVRKNGELVESYQYDVNGMRVLSTAEDVTTHYVYNFSQSVIYEKDSDTNQAEQEANVEEERYYIFSHNKIMAEVKGNAESGVEVYYYHQDNLGSTRMMTSGTGIVVMEQDYLPFGDDLRISGSVDGDGLTGYKYTGQGTTGVGLLYYKARYYDPEIGRFTREDEYRGDMSRPQTLNYFLYVLNNPINYIDPTGWSEVMAFIQDEAMLVLKTTEGDTPEKIVSEVYGINAPEAIETFARYNNLDLTDKLEIGTTIIAPLNFLGHMPVPTTERIRYLFIQGKINRQIYLDYVAYNDNKTQESHIISNDMLFLEEEFWNKIPKQVKEDMNKLMESYENRDKPLYTDPELSRKHKVFKPNTGSFWDVRLVEFKKPYLNHKGIGCGLEIVGVRAGKYSKDRRQRVFVDFFSGKIEGNINIITNDFSFATNASVVRMTFERQMFYNEAYDVRVYCEIFYIGAGVARGTTKTGEGLIAGYEAGLDWIPKSINKPE